MPRSRALPSTMIDSADSGVRARMLVVGCGLSFERYVEDHSIMFSM
jgi:hypothetical protein